MLAAGFAWLEGGTVSARDLTLVATLGGLAAAGRVLFAPIPSVQPVTVIVAAAGVALGPRRGFAVGALAAIASNFFLGQGPHTPWQMLAWGGCGLLAGPLRPFLRSRLAFVAFVLVLGFAFGMLMDTWLWFAFYPHTEAALLARLAAGVPFNVAHASGNVVLALVAGPELRRVLERFERRRERRSCGREAARRHRGRDRARDSRGLRPVAAARRRRLRRPQITPGRRSGSSPPGGHRRRGRATSRGTAGDRRPTSRSWRWRGPRPATVRMISFPRLRGHTPESWSTRRSGRSWRCGRPASQRRPGSCSAVLAAQRPTGGWSWLAGGAADTNDTAAAIQALHSAGVTRQPIDRGVAFLRRHQNRDGGFELTHGRGSDTQSTAWAIQGLLAAGRGPGAPAFRYLQRMRRPTGATATALAT